MSIIVNLDGKQAIEVNLDAKVIDSYKTVDSALSATSENPVQNKVVTSELNTLRNEVRENKTTSDEAFNRFKLEVETYQDSNDVLVSDLQENKADKEGYFPSMRVGLSDNLPDRGDVTEGSIGFRESAGVGNSIEDGTANVKELLGNSVVWNQLAKDFASGGWRVTDGTLGSLSFDNGVAKYVVKVAGTSYAYGFCTTYACGVQSHKHLLCLDAKSSVDGISLGYDVANVSGTFSNQISTSGFSKHYVFVNGSQSGAIYICTRNGSVVGAEIQIKNIQFIDLTQMFGAGNEPTSVEEFYSRIPQGVDLYAYNEGEVLGVNPTGIKSVNDNAWDEEWENGALNYNGGTTSYTNDAIVSKNFIPILPGISYYITSPYKDGQTICRCAFYDKNKEYLGPNDDGWKYFKGDTIITTAQNAFYMKFMVNTTTYNNDICIRLAHSGYKTDYVPHEEDVMPLDLSAYFPDGMHGVNGVRDSVVKNEATRRFGIVDLGTATPSIQSTNSYGITNWNIEVTAFVPDMAINDKPNVICKLPTQHTMIGNTAEEGVYADAVRNNALYIRLKSERASTIAEFQSAMSGVYLVYELAEPVVTKIDPQLNLSYKVWDFGTEELLCDKPSAQIVAKTIYGFNATDTIRGNKSMIGEHEERIEDLEKEVVRVGDYQPDLSVGVADQLAGNEDATPREFVMSQSGGGAILDGTARVETIKGNSVVWNQQLKGNYSLNSGLPSLVNNSTLSVTNMYLDWKVTTNNSFRFWITLMPSEDNIFVTGHKYIIHSNLLSNIPHQLYFYEGVNYVPASISDGKVGNMFITANTSVNTLSLFTTSSVDFTTEHYLKGYIQLIDLTQMFGAGNEPSTVEEFYARIPQNIDLYSYNEGTIVDMNVEKVKSVGRNLCNNDAEILSFIKDSQPTSEKTWFEEGKFLQGVAYNGNTSATKGLVTKMGSSFVIKGESGYGMAYMFKPVKGARYKISYSGDALTGIIFTTFYDSNKRYISHIYNSTTPLIPNDANIEWCVIGFAGNGTISNIDMRLADALSDGQYEPYISREQRLDIIAKYFPNGMKSAGTAHDEIRYNKATQKWEAVQRIGMVDLGTIDWLYQKVNDVYLFISNTTSKFYGIKDSFNGLCLRYIHASPTALVVHKDGYIDMFSTWFRNEGNIMIQDSRYGDTEEFKNSLNGVYLFHELAEPIVTEIEEEINLDYEVWNGGTEQAIADTPSTPLKADIVYGFNAYGVIKDLKAQLATMATQMAQMQLAMAQMVSTTSNEVE